jgi:16S rRNA (guanine966-N2)-methyltransferase
MNKPRHKSNNKNIANQLRIIGGQWRGRKLSFPSIEGLRPTPDRVRETLFNWLSFELPESKCLDLFAGSGALGLEALSRGAAYADLVDSADAACKQLNTNLQTLSATNATVHQTPAEQWLQQASSKQLSYDIIFLDPPFHRDLVASCIQLIEDSQLLTAKSWVYLEMASDEPLPELPENWQPYREKNAGQVCYRLFKIENQSEHSGNSRV